MYLTCLVITYAAISTSLCYANKTPFTGFIGKTSTSLESCAAAMDGVLPYGAPSNFHHSGTTRKFYIAAEEELWNYAPTGWDNWLGLPIEQSPRAQAVGYLQYGTKWLKALYRGYTDSTFTRRSEQPPWQGTQGPTIRAEQNDMIEIMFVNKLKCNYASMHSMGLAYNRDNEGSDYPNTTYPQQPSPLPIEGALPPGSCVVYKWLVNTPEGPNHDLPARMHAYHSFVSYREDSNAGLIGPSIIYAPGKMKSTMAQHREFTLLYMIYDENNSWLSSQNKPPRIFSWKSNKCQPWSTWSRRTYAAPPVDSPSNESYWHPQLVNYNASGKFKRAPSVYSMNGYVYANNPVFDMCLNDKVIWYVYSYGSASHTFHMHGNGFASGGVNMDIISKSQHMI